MSKTIAENQDAWNRKSWINDLANDKVLQANLTDDYAHDVLEAVAEGYFPTLDSAIAELSMRTGLTASEAGVIKTAAMELVLKSEEEVPGNKEDVPGDRLIKESPAEASSKAKAKTAGELPAGLKAWQEKNKKGGEDKEETMEKDECSIEDKKEAEASAKAGKTAYFQGADEASVDGKVTSNDPETLGYPGEIAYPNEPMQTTAPGGKDSRPYEQKAFEDSAQETKKVMGPKGEEFKLKQEMQRIPEGEKPANASAKRMGLIASIVASEKKSLNKSAGYDPEEQYLKDSSVDTFLNNPNVGIVAVEKSIDKLNYSSMERSEINEILGDAMNLYNRIKGKIDSFPFYGTKKQFVDALKEDVMLLNNESNAAQQKLGRDRNIDERLYHVVGVLRQMEILRESFVDIMDMVHQYGSSMNKGITRKT